jgi:hypothetical protein
MQHWSSKTHFLYHHKQCRRQSHSREFRIHIKRTLNLLECILHSSSLHSQITECIFAHSFWDCKASIEFKLNVLKNPDCFWNTNFILLIVLCWTTVFRTYLYTKQNDRKKITTQYFFSLLHRRQKIIFIHLSQHNHLFVTLYILFGYCVYIRIFCIDAKRKQRIEKCVFFSNWNNTHWSQFTFVGVFETFLCGCTCGWYEKENLDSWRGESSGHDPGDTRFKNYVFQT